MIEAPRYAMHEYPIAIRPTDIDALGHVNNAVYLEWVQNAVLSHWHAFADADAIAAFRWVAVRHEITYRKPAFLDDGLVASVLLERVRRESAYYETVIRRGDECVAEARSRWCCIEADTKRPARLPDTVIAGFPLACTAGAPGQSRS